MPTPKTASTASAASPGRLMPLGPISVRRRLRAARRSIDQTLYDLRTCAGKSFGRPSPTDTLGAWTGGSAPAVPWSLVHHHLVGSGHRIVLEAQAVDRHEPVRLGGEMREPGRE